ncbi:hypothetical protein HK104_002448 [Borealophlyctis nickersoniae]|nr:hypothetical protein HK104_002448 [Borealophlyctis nickersoniae]
MAMAASPQSTSYPGFSNYVRIDPSTWDAVKKQGQARVAGLKPFSEFFDRSRMSKPSSLNVFTTRLNFNLIYFQNNYLLIVTLCTLYLLFTNFWLLFTVFFLIGGFKFVSSMPANEPTVLPGGIMVTPKQLWPVLIVVGILLLWFTSVGGAIFWLVSVCALIVGTHAGFLEPPVEADFAEQQV